MLFDYIFSTRREVTQMEITGYDNQAEQKFADWANSKGIQHIYFHQKQETFSPAMQDRMKRPDFLVSVPGIGNIVVDVKARTFKEEYGTFILDEKDDTQKYIQFQQAFKLPVWFAINLKGSGFGAWYWISLDEILEKVETRKSGESGGLFRGVPLTICKTIGWNDGLAKLLSMN